MPSIGHLFLGGMVGYFLYLISGKKFSKYHAFILMMNNYMGPDFYWVTGLGGISHTVGGFVILSLFLAGMYSYFTRFSVDFKKKELIDLGTPRIPYLNTYFIVAAGGIMHNYLDGVINYGGNFNLWPDLTASINDFRHFWTDSPFEVNAVLALLIGMAMVMGYMYLYAFTLKVAEKHLIRNVLLYVILFMVMFFIFGELTTLHSDGGALLYAGIFWVIPLGLCTLSVQYKAKSKPESEKPAPGFRVDLRKSFKLMHLLIGALMILAGIAVILLKDTLTPIVVGLWDFLIPYSMEIGMVLFYLGFVFLFIGFYNITLFWYYTKRDISQNIMIVVGIQFLLGVVGFILLGVTLFAGNILVDWVFAEYTIGGIVTWDQLLLIARTLGLLFASISGFNYILGIGLLWNKKKIHRIAFLYGVSLAWTVLSLYVCCLLSEKEVIEKFR